MEPWGDRTARMHAMAVIPDYFHLQHLAHAQQCFYNFQKLTTPLSLHYSTKCRGSRPKIGRENIFLVGHVKKIQFIHDQYTCMYICLEYRISRSIGYHCCFTFGRSKVQIVAPRPVILTEAFHGFTSVALSKYCSSTSNLTTTNSFNSVFTNRTIAQRHVTCVVYNIANNK